MQLNSWFKLLNVIYSQRIVTKFLKKYSHKERIKIPIVTRVDVPRLAENKTPLLQCPL